MFKKLVIIAGTALLIVSFLGLFGQGEIQGANINYTPYIGPNVTPFAGNVVIYPNGTFTPGAPLSKSGDKYTLTSEIVGSLTDMFNGAIINGNGYMINGTGKVAFYLDNAGNVRISNLSVMDACKGFDLYYVYNVSMENLGFQGKIKCGIYIDYANNVEIENSLVNGTSSFGILSQYAHNLEINNDILSNNYEGMYLVGSNDAVVKNSVFNDSRYYGFLDLNSNNLFVNNVTFLHNYESLFVCYSSHADIEDIKVSNGTYPVYFSSDSNFSLSNSSITVNQDYTYIDQSQNGKIANSYFSKSEDCIIHLYKSTGIDLINDSMNQTTDCSDISLSESSVIAYNSTFKSVDYAVYADGGSFSAYSSYFNSSRDVFFIRDGASIHLTGDIIEESNTTYMPFTTNGFFGSITVNNSKIEAPKGGDSYAFYMYESKYSQKSGQISLNNDVFNNFAYDVYIYDFPLDSLAINGTSFYNSNIPIYSLCGALKVTVTNNRLYNNSQCMVYIENAASFNISDNRVLGSLRCDAFTVYDTFSYSEVENNFVNNSELYAMYFYCTNDIYVSGNTINSSDVGIYFEYSHGSYISDNSIENSKYGIYLCCYSHGAIYNDIIDASHYGIYLYESYVNQIYGNILNHDNDSLYTCYPYNDTFFANTIENTSVALYLYDDFSTYDNCFVTIYHNNFINFSSVEIASGSFAFWDISPPIGGNYWSNYTGTGVNGIGSTSEIVNGSNIDYYPLTHRWIFSTVTFIEKGLPNGSEWGITADYKNMVGTGNIVYQETNGQFMNVTFTPDHVAGYVPVKTNFTLDLRDNNMVVYVFYKPYNYTVSFTETGLTSGTTWSIDLNGDILSSSSDTITFSVPNGTYNYSIAEVRGYNMTVSSGHVTVKSSSPSVAVTFSETRYALTFTEKGLPAGMIWYVSINGQNLSSSSNSLTFYEVNGNYSYAVYAPSGYTVANSTGQHTISYSSANVSLTFTSSQVKPKISNSNLYIGLGGGAVVGLVVGSLATMALIRRRSPGKGKS